MVRIVLVSLFCSILAGMLAVTTYASCFVTRRCQPTGAFF